MCLFKRDEQENNCSHEGCQSYYLMNKQMCMFAKQNQEVKRAQPKEEQNLMDLLQKKIKKEADSNSYIEAAQQQVYPQQLTINPLLLTQKVQVPPKTEIPNNANMFFPMLVQQQNIQQALHAPSMDMNMNMSMNMNAPKNLSNLSLAQLINMNNQKNMINHVKPVEIPTILDNSQSLENSLKEFQSKVINLMLSQNKMLVDLKEKNDVIQDTISCLVGEVASLKRCVKVPTTEILTHPIGNPTVFTPIIGNTAEAANTDTLLTYLYGSNPDFQYQLVLQQEMSLPLYRERNFKFTVMLVDKNGQIVENTNRIPLSIGIYSSENPPKYIDSNTSGNKILKGFIEKDLIKGKATFEKIQIKEVTSHFRNGWIFFVVYPKAFTAGNMVTVDGNVNFVNGKTIKPLVLEKVVVKAKKTKEKDASVEAEENLQEEMEQEKEEVVYSNSSQA